MTRIALLGSGSMGRVHAQAYAALPQASVVAVFDRDPYAAAAVAAPLGATPVTDLTPILERADVDVVDCCLPTPLHRPIVEQVAAVGRPVICEKPLALRGCLIEIKGQVA
jgi:UDP-N-acetylglucosamine 3-dehydrogenase